MKKIFALSLYFINIFGNHDPLSSWWSKECLNRAPLYASIGNDGKNFVTNETCQAGEIILKLLKESPSKKTSEDQINQNNEWEETLNSTPIVVPTNPNDSSKKSTILGKITEYGNLSLLGELHMAKILYEKTSLEKVRERQEIINTITNNSKLLIKSNDIRNLYKDNIENTTQIYNIHPLCIEHFGHYEWTIKLFGTGKILGSLSILNNLAIPLGSLLANIGTLYSVGTAINNTAQKRSHSECDVQNISNNLALGTTTVINLIHNLHSLYQAIKNEEFNKLTPIYHANNRLVTAADEIIKLAEEYPEIKNMQSFSKMQKLQEKIKNDKNLERCFEILRDNPETWWNHNKTVLMTLLDKYKEEFAKIYDFVGEFETYSALAEIKNNFDKQNYPISFSQLTQDETSSLNIKKFWNPLIEPSKAIPNSLSLGSNTHDAVQHMIITGSNTGGKSTLLKGVIANTVLSQTYGIAFAKSMKHSYFDRILTSLNISDDTANNNSLFMSEILRAKNILNKIENGKNLIICDELFNGTSAENAGNAAAKVLSQFAKNRKNLSLFVTHHGKAVYNLGNQLPFKNYHIDATRNPDGSISYSYKLKEGISKNNIADDLLKENLDL